MSVHRSLLTRRRRRSSLLNHQCSDSLLNKTLWHGSRQRGREKLQQRTLTLYTTSWARAVSTLSRIDGCNDHSGSSGLKRDGRDFLEGPAAVPVPCWHPECPGLSPAPLCVCVCMHVWIKHACYLHVHVHARARTHTQLTVCDTHTNVQTCTHTNTHTHTHTHAHNAPQTLPRCPRGSGRSH